MTENCGNLSPCLINWKLKFIEVHVIYIQKKVKMTQKKLSFARSVHFILKHLLATGKMPTVKEEKKGAGVLQQQIA